MVNRMLPVRMTRIINRVLPPDTLENVLRTAEFLHMKFNAQTKVRRERNSNALKITPIQNERLERADDSTGFGLVHKFPAFDEYQTSE